MGPGGLQFNDLEEEQALTQLDLRPQGAPGSSAYGGAATHHRDMRFWRSAASLHWKDRFLKRTRFAFLPLISAAVLFAWQGFVSRVQYFDAVATSHSVPITSTIAQFVRTTPVTLEKLMRTTFGLPPATTYDAEMQMSPAALLDRWNPLVAQASRQFGVPEAWIRTVMRMESGGRTMSSETLPITSRAGAVGLMQVMPGTYDEMRKQYGLGSNRYDPHDNVFAGAAYLRWLHGRYGFPAMFAAYNDGPGHFENSIQLGHALPAETRNYVTRIAASLGADAGPLLRGAQGRVVKFTRPNGKAVSIAVADIVSVRKALPGEYAATTRTVITVGREHQAVRQTLAQVDAALHGRGATLRMAKTSRLPHLRLASLAKPKRISVSYSLGG